MIIKDVGADVLMIPIDLCILLRMGKFIFCSAELTTVINEE